MSTVKTLCRDFTTHGEHYVIAKRREDGIIIAVNYKYLDENGCITETLNGLQMFVDHTRNTVPQIIERITSYHEWREFLKVNHVNENDQNEMLKAAVIFYKLDKR